MPSPADFDLFATTPLGIEPLLAEELRSLGAAQVRETRAGASFRGNVELAFRVCLWSRLANRVILRLATFPAATPEALYEGARTIPWQEHLSQQGTLAVDCNIVASRISHSHYGALKVKDAVVDWFRDLSGVRPSVDLVRPDVRINLYLHRDVATIGIDLSGESLHRRGYREEGGAAPLKENLAAAILLRAGWPEVAAKGGPLLDPMCGSATLPIEAALLAGDIAPGLLRPYFGFLGWRGHDGAIWMRLLSEAQTRREKGLSTLPPITGFDADPRIVKTAWENVHRAGLQGRVHIERRDAADLVPPQGRAGLVVANPPYGERLGEVAELEGLYAGFGECLRTHFQGWRAAVFTGNPELGKCLGLRARRIHTLYNGALKCSLLHFDIDPESFSRAAGKGEGTPSASLPSALGPGGKMFANRLRKNLRNLGRWARRNGIGCYRLYDADLPEYAVAVDVYEQWIHVQEYEAPKSVDPKKADARLREVLAALPEVLEVPAERIFLKVRRRQKGRAQYRKLDEAGEFHEVQEGGCRFLVNFSDYLDTGLFLDHRHTRFLLGEMAAGRRFLNLFAYTGTATVYAAKGGAVSTTTVDMSRTYLDWARRNLSLNGFGAGSHRFIQADCLEWLAAEKGLYDLIFLDPPTFSASKRMKETFDVQRDHVLLLQAAAGLLAPEGVLIFSNNNRRFKMDLSALSSLSIEDITPKTIPKDFERNPRIHNCWLIKRP